MASLILAAAISWGWCLIAVHLGPRIGYVDHPDRSDLTAHESPAVPLGGVGIFLAVHGTAIALGGLDAGLLLASGIVLLLGLVDDRVGLSPMVRIAVEVVAAAVLVGTASYSDSGIGFTLIAVALVVFAINAVNLYDGLDGLAAVAGILSSLALAVIASDLSASADLALALAGGLGGFLVLNWAPARVFLGDSGAYLTGLVLAHLVLQVGSPSAPKTMLTAGVLGVFAIDLLASVLRRWRSGKPLFAGDRSHVYDQLRDRGHSVPRVVLISGITQAVFVALVVAVSILVSVPVGLLVIATAAAATLALLGRMGFLAPLHR